MVKFSFTTRLGRWWRSVDRLTVPGLFVLIGSVGATAVLWANQIVLWEGGISILEVSNESMKRTVCLVVLVLGSALAVFVRSLPVFRVVVALKVLFLELLVDISGGLRVGEMVLLAVLLVEICLYEALVISAILAFLVLMGTQYVAAMEVLKTHTPEVAPSFLAVVAELFSDQIPIFLQFSLLIVPACLMVFYREKAVVQERRLAQLDSVVARLSATNLGYQTFAHEAAAKSQLEERLRISRELHDIVGYTFTNNIMMMEAAMTKIHKEPDRVQSLIDLARDNAKTGYDRIREALYQLRVSSVEKTPSLEKIRKMINVFQVATQIDVTVSYHSFPRDLDEEVESFFYHFVQESLTNAFLHGGATKVEVNLFQTDSSLSASVADNGNSGGSFQEGIGLKGMRERLEHLNGSLEIRNHGHGFELLVDVPRG